MALNVVSSDRLSTNVKTSNLATGLSGKVGESKNLIINGAMQVAQRGTVTGVTTSSYGGPDRWQASRADAPGTWQLSQVADAPTGSGFSHCLEHKVTTANGSLDAGDEAVIQTTLEGQDLTQVKKGTSSAEQLTLSFWCKSSTTGTYIVEFYDTDNNRQCSKSYTISSAATWEKKTITFPADTTGAFTADNNSSLAVKLWVAAGTTWTSGTLSTTWTSPTDANRAVGQVNLSATLNNYFRLTGVQLEIGETATEFEHKTFALDLLECQRYLQYVGYTGQDGQFCISASHMTSAGDQTRCGYYGPTNLRATPSITEFGDGLRVIGSAGKTNTPALSIDDIAINYPSTMLQFNATMTDIGDDNEIVVVTNTVSGGIKIECEL